MSATGRGRERIARDAYYTPQKLADAIVHRLPVGARMLEPHVGGGAFVRAARARRPVHVVGVDINPDAPGLALVDEPIVGDFLTVKLPCEPDLIVANPPFQDAELHVRRALEVASPGGTVAFLLRLAFLESAKRKALWREHRPAAVWVLVERPSFAHGGTDSAAYGVFVWHGHHEATRLDWLSWGGGR